MFKKNFVDLNKIQNKMNNVVYVNEVESAELNACVRACVRAVCKRRVRCWLKSTREREKKKSEKRVMMWKKQCVKRRKKEEKKNLNSWNHNQHLSHSQLTISHRWCLLISILILLALILFDAHWLKQLHQLHQAQLIQHLDVVNDDINDLTLAVLQHLQFLVNAVLDDEMNDEDFEELIDAKDVTEDLLFHAAVSSQIDANDAQDQFLVNVVLNDMTSDEDFEELINAEDVTEDLLFHAVVSSQIDADDAQD